MTLVPPGPADGMDAARWRRIDSLFAAALERPLAERGAFLDAACGGDPELRRDVESLLARDRDDGFLVRPAASEVAALLLVAEEAPPAPRFAPGQVLGNRFRLTGDLGRGGMGEVWRAHDLKLRVDVALKAVRPELLVSPAAARALREEVRCAREVVSPNVCRVFDLVEADGSELLSMEYVDGRTLADLLAERAPLPLEEAQDVAAQLLAGLEAIHAAGLVHRDVKPENVMVTAAGRVVVMDFGIARAAAEPGTHAVAGTPSYMAPEQLRGEPLDARADVFSAAMVLAETIAPRRRRGEAGGTGGALPDLGDAPWAPVLRRAVSLRREDRHPGAAALARALEEVTRRTAAAEHARPYPGLAAFESADREHFFGREAEIETMWRKLRRPRLRALIGPSGAGKSSFLQAGLVATAPDAWGRLLLAPGDRPFAALARVLAPELAGDPAAVAGLLELERPETTIALVARWRQRHEQALLVVDSFEELFTRCAPEAQERFAALLARLPLDADVHVVLALRDDFLFHCHRLPPLAPLFADVTPLGPPTGDALRRALVQPALRWGYRFEDEAIVEALLAEVQGERGALPLVAFTMARLWERRDRERGLLTRQAYDELGGVAGALAGHAEATLASVGSASEPLVREIFRNLVTAEGTRTAVDRDELLSVFPAAERAPTGAPVRERAAAVLEALVDSRLVTSYELPPGEGAGTGRRRIEVIHESLLASWPRLVRWQRQDEQGALLRDQLRQAARLWEERGKPEDLLWTGTSLRELQLWRERYPGGLSAAEERFVRATTARDRRRRRRARVGLAAVLAAAVGTASAMALLWQRSETARAAAVAAAGRAAAEQLFTRGQVELESNPTAAVAYALASLERLDTPHARLLALRALWRGPTAFEVARDEAPRVSGAFVFSPDGRWLLSADGEAGAREGPVRLWSDDGSPPRTVVGPVGLESFAAYDFAADSRSLLVLRDGTGTFHALPEVEPVLGIEGVRAGVVRGDRLVTADPAPPGPSGTRRWRIRTWRLPAGELATDAEWGPSRSSLFRVDPAGGALLNVAGGALEEWPLSSLAGPPRPVLRQERPILTFLASPDGERIYTLDPEGESRAWSRADGSLAPAPRMQVPHNLGSGSFVIAVDGRTLVRANGNDERTYLWDLEGPVAGDPLVLRRGARVHGAAVHPGGRWLATREDRAVTVWPLARQYPRVLRGPGGALTGVAVDPLGSWVAAGVGFPHNQVWVWPLRPRPGARKLEIDCGAPPWFLVALPDGRRLAVGTHAGVRLLDLASGAVEPLPGFSSLTRAVAVDRDGRRLAAGGGLLAPLGPAGEAHVRVWDLVTGEVQVLDAGDGLGIYYLQFLADGRLLSTGLAGVRIWDLAEGTAETVLEGVSFVTASPDGRRLLGIADRVRPGGMVGEAFVYDLRQKQRRALPHGREVTFVAWHPSGAQVVTGSRDGTVRIGPAEGEPHLLFGHERSIWALQVDPPGASIVSASEDGTVRLWPIPQGPPLHTAGRDALLALLRSLTNYRVRESAGGVGGHRLETEPFRGWRDPPPTW